MSPKEIEIYNSVYRRAYESGALGLMISNELAETREVGAPYSRCINNKAYSICWAKNNKKLSILDGDIFAGASIGYDRGLRGEKLHAFASTFNKLVNDGVGPVNIPFLVTAMGRGRSPLSQSAYRTLMLFTSFPLGYTQGLINAIKLVLKDKLNHLYLLLYQ